MMSTKQGRAMDGYMGTSIATFQKSMTLAALLLLFVSGPTVGTSAFLSGMPLTEESDFFGELRNASAAVLNSKTKVGSAVVEVTTSKNKKNQARDEAVGANGTTVYRLCEITTMLPLSDGNGNARGYFGLYPSAATLLAVDHFNNKTSTIVPDLETNARIRNCNIRLTMEVQDSRRSPIEANRVLIDDILSRKHSLETPKPIALVGASRSAVSAAISITASTGLLPVISASSLSSLLDNKGIYSLFGRTNAGSSGDAWAAVSYLRHVQNVTHMGLLFVRDEYGSAFHSDFTQAAFALDPPMRIVSASYEPDGGSDSIRVAVKQLADAGFNYFFGVILQPSFHQVLREARQADIIGVGKFWLFSNDLGRFEDYRLGERDLVDAMDGITSLSFDVHHKEFEEVWKTIGRDEYWKAYFLAKQPDYLDLSDFELPFPPSDWEFLAYDAVIALGIAACESDDYFFDGPSLFDSFKRTSFMGASGRVDFEPTGSRNPTNIPYKVSNIVANEPNRADGTITFSVQEVARQVGIKWNTTNPTIYAGGSNVPPPILPPTQENKNMISVGAVAFGLTLAGLVMAMSVIWGVWTIVNRNARVVQLSQPTFLMTLCVGTFIMASSVIPMSLQEPISEEGLSVACMSVPWLYSIGFVLTFSALFSKTAKVNKLFNSTRRLKRMKLKAKEFILPFIVIFSSTIIILISWTVAAPLRWHRRYFVDSVDSYGRQIESYATCKPNDGNLKWIFVILLGVIDFVSLVFALYQSYRARKIPTEDNESRYIALSILCIFQSFALGFFVLLSAYPDPTSVFLLSSILVSVICGAVLIPLFVPKEMTRRNDVAMEETRRQSQASQPKAQREWQIWQALTSKNESSKNEGGASNASNPLSSGNVVESHIYYGAHNSFWENEPPPPLKEGSNEDGRSSVHESSSSHGSDSDDSFIIQQAWNPGLDQLCLSSGKEELQASPCLNEGSSDDGKSPDEASSSYESSSDGDFRPQQAWNPGLDDLVL